MLTPQELTEYRTVQERISRDEVVSMLQRYLQTLRKVQQRNRRRVGMRDSIRAMLLADLERDAKAVERTLALVRQHFTEHPIP